ncbi:MAG: hypothetical protein KIT11_00290 [Fimbriimonadaceae bacterium]|nr:hypothetical protein [Fimbriimonadaceae bacterium]QYK55189.1 MAG: hypothetical protein KF733_09245 [Fimbriimonadaceae bacterium]
MLKARDLFLRPVPVIAGGLALFGLATARMELVLIGGVVWVVNAFFAAMRAQRAEGADQAELGAEALSMVRPIREARDSLRKTAAEARNQPEVSVIAGEAAEEADLIYAEAAKVALARQKLKQAIRGRGAAATAVSRLERQIADSANPEEREALDRALASRRVELGHLDEAQRKIDVLASKLREAEAALSEIRAMVTRAVVQSDVDSASQDEMTGMLQRLKTLGKSFEEASELTEDLRA